MFDLEIIKNLYNELATKTNVARDALKRPLTFTEKVLFNHIDSNENQDFHDFEVNFKLFLKSDLQ